MKAIGRLLRNRNFILVLALVLGLSLGDPLAGRLAPSVLPLLALVMINVAQPNYYDEVRETVYFMPAAIAVGVFLVVNIIVMRALVNIKV